MFLKIAATILLEIAAVGGWGEIMFEQPRNYGVYQRRADNTAEVPVIIRNAPGIKNLDYRYHSGDAWQPLKLQRQTNGVTSSVKLPAGGWYKLEFKVENTDGKFTETAVDHIGVGEVFITAGQSNSANWSEPKQKTATGLATVFDGEKWRPAVDPLPVCDGKLGSVWPLVGDRLSTELKMPVGFLCLGVGGTAVSQWTPENYRNKVAKKQCYGRFVKYVPRLKPYGCRAVLWHQGETDRMSRQEPYYRALKSVIAEFKHDFGDTPWLVATVGNRWMDPKSGIGCRAAQQQIIVEGLARRGPDTDVIGKKFRLKEGKSSHFNQPGIEAHAALWCEAIEKELLHERR